MSDFPIFEIIPAVKEQLLLHNTLLLQASPGAGKSTILPLHLMNEPWLDGKKIIILEPRRLAARTIANRMASLLKEKVGQRIGYRIRFDNCIGDETQIEIVTEGILTKMLQNDTSLENVGLIIFDEFHERNLHSDLAIVLCRQIQLLLRPDLRILIMSATLETKSISEKMGNIPVLYCKGIQYPVSIVYSSVNSTDSIPVFMEKAIRKALLETKGDILAFLPGSGEIVRTQQLLEEHSLSISIHPLYGDLSIEKQQQAIQPHAYGKRKVVLATSIAETSLTIEGISVVIDSGYSRTQRFDPKTGLSHLETVRVTKDAADQRAGRAARLGPGICYRMWTKETQNHLQDYRKPEILEAELSSLVLNLSLWGIKNLSELEWITLPPLANIKYATELLIQLNAINDHLAITEKGKSMNLLPTHPRIAHMLLEAIENKVPEKEKIVALATDIAALLEERDILSKEFGADIALRIEELRKWRRKEAVIKADYKKIDRTERLAAFWRQTLRIKADNFFFDEKIAGQLVMAAYPERIAKQISNDKPLYRLMNGKTANLLPYDPLAKNEYLVIANLDASHNEGKIFLASAIDVTDIFQRAKENQIIEWNSEKGMIEAFKEMHIGHIRIAKFPLEDIPEEKRIALLCQAIRDEGLNSLHWDESSMQRQARILSIKKWRPLENWPDVSSVALLTTLEKWLAPYLIGITKRAELKQLNLNTILMGFLSYDENKRLEELVPEKLKVPSGSFIKVSYFQDGSSAEMAVRLQEVFGLYETPTINAGKTKVLLHLLSPAYRPVQLTQDLKSFWINTYKEVRKELRARYPKHYWPENPLEAQAVKGVKRK